MPPLLGSRHAVSPPHRPAASDAADTLVALSRLAMEWGAPALAQEAEATAERVRGGRYYVAFLGQFKRGKSTVINSLLGIPLLPTGISPVTAIPTVVRYGELAARVRMASGEWVQVRPADLVEYLSQNRNPDNVKRVTAAEVFVPDLLLASGMCLVDTPGLGSVFERNTEATREFLPQIDAAVVVLGLDPPISKDELRMAVEVERQVGHLIFVLNKGDRMDAAGRSEAVAFTERILGERLSRPPDRFLVISAVHAEQSPDLAEGWLELGRRLRTLADAAGQGIVDLAAQRGAERVARRLKAVLAEHRDALIQPAQAIERRLRRLADLTAAAERMRLDLTPLFAAEQQRLALLLDSHRNQFVAEAVPLAQAALRASLISDSRYAASRHHAMALAREEARSRLQSWYDTTETWLAEAYHAAATRFADIGREFLARLGAGELGSPESLPDATELEATLRAPRRFHFHEMLHLRLLASPLRWMADRVLPGRWRRPSITRDALHYLATLLEVNSSRIQGDLGERVLDSRRGLEQAIIALLHDAYRTTHLAAQRAREVKAVSEAAVRQELDRIAIAEQKVAGLIRL